MYSHIYLIWFHAYSQMHIVHIHTQSSHFLSAPYIQGWGPCRHYLIFHPHIHPVIQQILLSPLYRCGHWGLEILNSLPPGHTAGKCGTCWASETTWRERPSHRPTPKPQACGWDHLRTLATATSWLHEWTQARTENPQNQRSLKLLLF